MLPAVGLTAANVEAGSANQPAQAAPRSEVVEVKVSSGRDDAEERTDGTMDLGSSDLELVTDPGKRTAIQRQLIGIRFAKVDVPVGATITNAYLEFRVDKDTSSEPTSLLIRGEASTDSKAFTKKLGDIRVRRQTAAFIQWTAIEPWTKQGEVKRSIDLSPIVAEVISLRGWTPGDPMTFLIDGYGRRVATSFNGAPASAPVLHIEYTVDGPPDPPPPPEDTIVSSDVTLTSTLKGSDWSGLVYQNGSGNSPGVLWAVNNGDSELVRIPDGAAPNTPIKLTDDIGRAIDAEAVTIDESGRIFVGAEGRSGGKPNAIHEYDVQNNSAQLVRSWTFGNVGEKSPIFPSPIVHNKGIEALAWMPYSAFGEASNPYAARGDSIPGFLAVGTETSEIVYLVAVYAGQPTRYEVVSKVKTGLTGIMALEWDGRQLWAYCDNACDQKPPRGGSPADHFAIIEPNGLQLQLVETGPTAPSLVGQAMEGFALKPVGSCDPTTGLRQAWWSNDAKSPTSLAVGAAGRC